MKDFTVDELYNYILKDSDTRKKMVRDDVEHSLLSADVLNTLLLANHPEVFEYNPDTELEHIDAVLGKPDMNGDPAWVQDANIEQLPEDLADKVNKNLANAERYKDFELPSELTKNNDGRTTNAAKDNLHNVVLDRILKNVYKNKDMSDEQKKLFALRLLYNNATKGKNKILPDIKLTQPILREELANDEIWNKLMENDASLLSHRAINTDYLPLTYNSDKVDYDDITWDDDGKQYTTKRTKYLFHPLEDSKHVYDIFVNGLADDITNGNKDVQDPYGLAKYIEDKYNNALRVMSYDDWEKEFAKLDNTIDEAELEEKVQKEVERRKQAYGIKEGIPGVSISKKEIDDIRDSIRAAMSDVEVNPNDVLMPEDFTDQVPDKPRDRSKPNADRHNLIKNHGDELNEWNRYLQDRAAAAGFANTGDGELDTLLKEEQDSEKEKAYSEVAAYLRDTLYKKTLDAFAKVSASLEKTTDPKAYTRLSTQLNNLGNKLKFWKNEVFEGTDEGAKYLEGWAQRWWALKHRKNYNLKDPETIKAKTVNELKEMYDNDILDAEMSRYDTEWSRTALNNMNKLFKDIESNNNKVSMVAYDESLDNEEQAS